jgi:hypothetical protein
MFLGGFTGSSLAGNMVEGNGAFKPHSKLLNGRLISNLRFVSNAQLADGTTPAGNFTFNSTSGDDASFNETVNPANTPLVNRQGGFFFNNNNSLFFYPFGFQWREIPLSGVRTLKFYVYVNNCTATFSARLSDGSALRCICCFDKRKHGRISRDI